MGRISRLDDHLKPEWWKHLFNAIYLKTDGDVVCDPDLTAAEVDLIVDRLALRPSDSLLDLCCGQGRHSLELARRGFVDVTGADQSAFLISRAKRDGRRERLPVRFQLCDARELPFRPARFDAVIVMGNSLGYSESFEEDARILQQAARVLRGGGKLFLDIADGEFLRDSFEPRSWEWIDDELFVCRERQLSADGLRLISRELVCHAKKGVIADQVYAEKLYSPVAMTELLRGAGFGDFLFWNFSTPSARNEDLGMMAKRLMVSAVLHERHGEIPVAESREAMAVEPAA